MRTADPFARSVVALLKVFAAALIGVLAGRDRSTEGPTFESIDQNSRTFQHLSVVGLSGPEVTLTPHASHDPSASIVIPRPEDRNQQIWTEFGARDNWRGAFNEAEVLKRTFLRSRFRTNLRPDEGEWLDSDLTGLAVRFVRPDADSPWSPDEDFAQQHSRAVADSLSLDSNRKVFERIVAWNRAGGNDDLEVEPGVLYELLHPGGRFMLTEHTGPPSAGEPGRSAPMPYSALSRLYTYDWLRALEGPLILTLRERSEGGLGLVGFQFEGTFASDVASGGLRTLLSAQIEADAALDYSHELEGKISMEGYFFFHEEERRLLSGHLTAEFSCEERGLVRVDYSSGKHTDYAFVMKWDGTLYCDMRHVSELEDW